MREHQILAGKLKPEIDGGEPSLTFILQEEPEHRCLASYHPQGHSNLWLPDHLLEKFP